MHPAAPRAAGSDLHRRDPARGEIVHTAGHHELAAPSHACIAANGVCPEASSDAMQAAAGAHGPTR